jgi:hypothetical protein
VNFHDRNSNLEHICMPQGEWDRKWCFMMRDLRFTGRLIWRLAAYPYSLPSLSKLLHFHDDLTWMYVSIWYRSLLQITLALGIDRSITIIFIYSLNQVREDWNVFDQPTCQLDFSKFCGGSILGEGIHWNIAQHVRWYMVILYCLHKCTYSLY